MPRETKLATKAAIAEQIRNEHLAIAAGTPDDDLRAWSHRTYNQLRQAEIHVRTCRAHAQALEARRKDARTWHRAEGSSHSGTVWREAVAKADEAQAELRRVREEKNRLEALSKLLATLLAQRNAAGGKEEASEKPMARESVSGEEEEEEEEEGTRLRVRNRPSIAEEADETGRERKRRQRSKVPAPPENCPFCQHGYTVRDGTLEKTDGEGRRLQLRKCQCRSMAPPCRNCPSCRMEASVMAASGEEQLRLCREEVRCEVCACECPGAGKWIEGDPDSRLRYRARAMRRYEHLSALVNGSWSLKAPSGTKTYSSVTGDEEEGCCGISHDALERAGVMRLPADIKDQLEAVAAAQSLQRSFFLEDETMMQTSMEDSRASSEEALVDGARRKRRCRIGGRRSSGRMAVLQSQDDPSVWSRPCSKVDECTITSPSGGGIDCKIELGMAQVRGREEDRNGSCMEGSWHGEGASIGREEAMLASDPRCIGFTWANRGGTGEEDSGERREGDGALVQPCCGAEVHIHRCSHPHEECTSDCCSVAGAAGD